MHPILSALAVMSLPAAAEPEADGPFNQRGYYITFMRMPTYDLDGWKRIVDGIHDDGGNTLLLWVAGAFRSEKYPITWRYNAEHENVRNDFVRNLIDHAHSKGISGCSTAGAGRTRRCCTLPTTRRSTERPRCPGRIV